MSLHQLAANAWKFLTSVVQGCESSSFQLISSFLKIFWCQNFSLIFYFQPFFGILPWFHAVFPCFLPVASHTSGSGHAGVGLQKWLFTRNKVMSSVKKGKKSEKKKKGMRPVPTKWENNRFSKQNKRKPLSPQFKIPAFHENELLKVPIYPPCLNLNLSGEHWREEEKKMGG